MTLAKWLLSLSLSFLTCKCWLGLGYSEGPLAQMQKDAVIISAVAGLLCVRNLSLKAFLMAVPFSLCWGLWTNSQHPLKEEMVPQEITIRERSGESAKDFVNHALSHSLQLPVSSASWLNCLGTGFSCLVLQV